tara:strand:+ start:97 stop:207 length:111 start_codon:yes stop_codon:yes gene_type:complete
MGSIINMSFLDVFYDGKQILKEKKPAYNAGLLKNDN